MVSWLSVIFSAISTILALVVPVVVAIIFCRRTRTPYSTVLVGALTFFVAQIVLRIPLLGVAEFYFPLDITTVPGVITYTALLALTAALFEELGRWAGFKFFRRRGDWNNAVAMGIGHGGIEAILLVGIGLAVNTVILAMLAMDIPLEGVLSDLSPEVLQPLLETPPHMFLLGGLERSMTMLVHVALSILVVSGAARWRYDFILMAIVAHFFLNFPVNWLADLSIWAAELYIIIWAMGAWIFIRRSRTEESLWPIKVDHHS